MNNMLRLPRFLLLTVLASCAIGASLSANAQSRSYRYRQVGSGAPVVVFETWKSVRRQPQFVWAAGRDIVLLLRGQ